MPNGEAEARDSSLTSFSNSRGLFQQTLTNHQQSMASHHQMALHEIGNAINHASRNNPNTTVPAANSTVPPSVDKNTDGRGVVPAAAVENNTAGVVPSVPYKYMLQNSTGSVLQNSSSGLVQNGSHGGLMTPDSIISCDSLNALSSDARRLGRDGSKDVRNVGHQISAAVVSNPNTSTSSGSCGLEVSESSHDHIRADVNGYVSSSTASDARPTSHSNGTHPEDQSQNGTSRVAADLSSVETNHRNVSGQSCGTVVTETGTVAEGSGVPCGGGSPSFFLHRNVPSPNIAIVQPSVHPVMPQSTPTDHCSQVYPTSAIVQPSVHPVMPQSTPTDHCSQVYPTSAISSTPADCSPQDWNVSRCVNREAYPARNVEVNQQAIVSFVSTPSTVIHAACAPNTMEVLPPGKDDVHQLKSPDTYRKSSFDVVPSTSGTIFAIPPSCMPVTNLECPNHDSPTSGFPSGKSPVLDFPTSRCVKDNITYDEIPVDDTSSVSSITSDVAASTKPVVPGRQNFVHLN